MTLKTDMAVCVSAQQFDKLICETSKARFRAQDLIQEAEEKARSMIAEATSLRDQAKSELRDLADRAIDEVIDEDRLYQHARICALLFKQVSDLRNENEKLIPWLCELVETVVRKIIGEIEEPELITRLVREGLQRMPGCNDIVLTVHSSKRELLEEAQKAFPRLDMSIKSIEFDDAMNPELLSLRCKSGSIDFSVNTQIARVLELIRDSNEAENES